MSDAKLIFEIKADQSVTTLKYSGKIKSLVWMDSECSLGAAPLNLSTFGKVVSKDDEGSGDDDEALINEIDMDDIADAIGEDEEEEPKAEEKDVMVIDTEKKEQKAEKNDSVASEADPEEESGKVIKAGSSLLADPEAKKRKVTWAKQADTLADFVIDVDTQLSFVPNCRFDTQEGKIKVLNWNMIGTVGVRHEFQYTTIDIEFTNKNFHRNLSIKDDFGVCMSAMNYSGAFLASRAEEKTEDEYEEDEMDMDPDNAEQN